MVDRHGIAKRVIRDYIQRRESFSFLELQDAIINAGGILRVSPGTTIGEEVNELEERGVIKFNPSSNKYNIIGYELLEK